MSRLERVPKIDAVPHNFHGTIITDCADPNAEMRQETRFAALFEGHKPTFVPLTSKNQTFEAAGYLVDALDATTVPSGIKPTPSLILVNEAPRGSEIRKDHENGTPFCYFKARSGNTTVFTTYDERMLAIAGITSVQLMDIPEVTKSLVDQDLLKPGHARTIRETQFRSFEFLPLAARYLIGGIDLPATEKKIPKQDDIDDHAWHIDNFGNIKTTSLPKYVEVEGERKIHEDEVFRVIATDETVHEAPFIPRLADVPDGKLAVTIGSSGGRNKRWLEVVVAQDSAAERLGGVAVGDKIFESR